MEYYGRCFLKMLEFMQCILKIIIKSLDGCYNYDIIVDSGKCVEDNNKFITKTITPPNVIIDKLVNSTFFNINSNIDTLINNLNLLSECANKNNLLFSFLLTKQLEYVNVISSNKKEENLRKWSNIKIGLTLENGKTIYKDLIIGKSIDETIKKINVVFNLLLEDVQYMKQEIQLPESPTTIVFAEGTGGFLIHEILGHMVEGDFVTKGISLFGNKISIGDKIGAENLNVIDDPFEFSDYIGLCNIDDEGETLSEI